MAGKASTRYFPAEHYLTIAAERLDDCTAIPARLSEARADVGKYLRQAREALGLSASTVARGATVDLGNLRNIEAAAPKAGRPQGAWSEPVVTRVLAFLTEQAQHSRTATD